MHKPNDLITPLLVRRIENSGSIAALEILIEAAKLTIDGCAPSYLYLEAAQLQAKNRVANYGCNMPLRCTLD